MEALTWVIFISSLIVGVVLVAITLLWILDDDAPILLPLTGFVFPALIFYVALNLFSPWISIWIWRGLDAALFLAISTFIVWNVRDRSLVQSIFSIQSTILIAVILSTVPFIIGAPASHEPSSYSLNSSGLLTWLGGVFGVVTFIVAYIGIRRTEVTVSDKLDSIGEGIYGANRYGGSELFRRNLEEYQFLLRRYFEDSQMRLDSVAERLERAVTSTKRDYVDERISEKSGSTRHLPEKFAERELQTLSKTIYDLTVAVEGFQRHDQQNEGIYSSSTNQIFIRELYHFLITPLSQIETKTIILTENPNLFEDIDHLRKTVNSFRVSVEICKSVLAAYRELAFISASSDWSPDSLQKSVHGAGQLYKENVGKDLPLGIELQDRYEGYSNNYLVAILLPLLENAITASPSDSEVTIVGREAAETLEFEIKNRAIKRPRVKDLNTPGFSSKLDHVGTGISIARHLVEDQNKGTIDFLLKKDLVVTLISLPKRKK